MGEVMPLAVERDFEIIDARLVLPDDSRLSFINEHDRTKERYKTIENWVRTSNILLNGEIASDRGALLRVTDTIDYYQELLSSPVVRPREGLNAHRVKFHWTRKAELSEASMILHSIDRRNYMAIAVGRSSSEQTVPGLSQDKDFTCILDVSKRIQETKLLWPKNYSSKIEVATAGLARVLQQKNPRLTLSS